MFDYKEWWEQNKERVTKHRLYLYHNDKRIRLMYRLRASLWYHAKQLSSLLTSSGKIIVDKSSYNKVYSNLPTEVIAFYRKYTCIELYLTLLYIKSSGLKLSVSAWLKLLQAVLKHRVKTKEGVIAYAKKLQKGTNSKYRGQKSISYL